MPARTACTRRGAVLAAAFLAAGAAGAGGTQAAAGAAGDDAPRYANAWRTLRIVDCARCHGKHHDGSSGPSVIEYARTQQRDLFVRAVLDGNPGRGMPGYRDNALVAAAIDDIHLYFKALADGVIARDWRPATP